MPNYLSISQINKYLGCGEVYRLHYIEGKKSPPNVAMIKGSAFHKAAEINNIQKKKSKKDLSVEELKEIASNDLDSRLSCEVWYTKKQKENISKTKGDAKDSLIMAIDQLSINTKDVMPIEVEAEFNIQIPGIKKPLKAVIDCITDDNRVIDYKVTSTKITQFDTNINIQLMAYALIHRVNYGVFPKTEFHSYLTKNTKTYGHQIIFDNLSIHHNEDTISPLLNTIKVVSEGIEKGIFIPAAKGIDKPFSCSPNHCKYYQNCKYINGKPRFGL